MRVLPLLAAALARRETPQELSHDRYVLLVKQMLDLNNTISVQDPTFGLLANNLASAGMGSVNDANCLQLVVADVALTNARAANNVEGQVACLIYRALERNTAAVGIASEQCTTYTPHNKELSTFRQHQDPASPGAHAENKATVLELARQILFVGGDPTDALHSGTFEQGDLSSTEAAGYACNTPDCIFTSTDALVRDASQSEIYEYVGKCTETVTSTLGANGSNPTGVYTIFDQSNSVSRTISNGVAPTIHLTTPASSVAAASTTNAGVTNPAAQTSTQQSQPAATQSAQASPATPTPTTTTASSSNLQTFTDGYLGIYAPAVTQAANGKFQVDGDNSFSNLKDALMRSCSNQHNSCANEANKQRVSVQPCDSQQQQCQAKIPS